MTKKFLKAKKFAGIVALLITLCIAAGVFAACGGGGGDAAITLSETSLTLYEGDSGMLTATTKKVNAEVEWSSSDTSVVTVRKGVLETLAQGTAVITASLESGESATCAVDVKVRTITISETAITIDLGSANKTFALTASADDNGIGNISWTSSNPTVATVSGGVVTALDMGETIITAQKGRAQATCVVTVTDASRPADYYLITPADNAGTRADKGTWHYFADGTAGDCSFSAAPLHANSSLSVTFSIFPDHTNMKFFYFRYQPYCAVGGAYTISFDVETNVDCILRHGTSYGDSDEQKIFTNTNLTANTSESISYAGTVNEKEPFSIRINSATVPSGVQVQLKVSNIVITGEDERKDEEDEEEEQVDIVIGDYLEQRDNNLVVSSQGNWYYKADGANGSEYKFSTEPNYNSSLNILSMGFEWHATGTPTYQFRYQPNYAVGTNYTVTFDAKLTAAGTIVYGNNYKSQVLARGESASLSWTGAVSATAPFMIQVRAIKPANPITIIVSNIVFTPEGGGEEPDVGTALTMLANKAAVRANPGNWYYHADGTENTNYKFSTPPTQYANGTLKMGFEQMDAVAASPVYQLRYQPDYEAGTNFTVTFTVTVTEGAGRVVCGYDNTNVLEDFVAGQTEDYTWSNTVSDNGPFFIQIRPVLEDRLKPITITVSNIVFTADGGDEDDDEELGVGTALTMLANREAVRNNPGNWYYHADKVANTDYKFSTPPTQYENGTLRMGFEWMEADGNPVYQFRYQPDYAAGTNYTVTFTVKITEGAGRVVCGDNSGSSGTDFAASQTADLTWSGTVSTDGPFFIQIRSTVRTAPITITVSNIVFTAV